MRICFLTSTPLNFKQGSGTFTGITTLAEALQTLGVDVKIESAASTLRPYTLRRYLFNRRVAKMDFSSFDAVVGFDLDGYLVPEGMRGHIACVKGVIADELQFEHGLTRAALWLQSRWEQQNVDRARHIITTSRYSAQRIQALYGYGDRISVIPELIDLARWQRLFDHTVPERRAGGIRLLCVCRFYPRKNLQLLLRTMAELQQSDLSFELRLVGNGAQMSHLRELARDLHLKDSIIFPGDLTTQDLAKEYRQADIFCFPSRQEGFGIVLLEAMAAGLPIVAAAHTAIPEVVPHAKLVAEDDPVAWGRAILDLAHNAELRQRISREGLVRVRQFEATRVAAQFLSVVTAVSNGTPVLT